MNYTYKIFWQDYTEEEIEESGGNLDTEFTSSVPIEIGHHIEQVHGVAEVVSILHNKFDNDCQLVLKMISTVEEYGIR
ncbi:hypothetical protein SNR37_003930 [Agarivorans aestuarii]|uniref:Uncharacterized protein n=1 Tax=Agarivorans aestuarii TaxID=1563703 RepID=A0ABU7G525_9ALTE|nr:hypothetical protein [Agarivorans aestuarii]MEE1674487.1 hypothetical protein [Agarivorans aestuarii]